MILPPQASTNHTKRNLTIVKSCLHIAIISICFTSLIDGTNKAQSILNADKLAQLIIIVSLLFSVAYPHQKHDEMNNDALCASHAYDVSICRNLVHEKWGDYDISIVMVTGKLFALETDSNRRFERTL